MSEKTAHDPRVTLTETEIDRLVFEFGDHTNIYALTDMVADLIAARLAPIRALAEEATERAYWDISLREMLTVQATGPNRAKVPPHWRAQAESEARVPADALLAALDAPQDAPRGPVGGEQGAEVAGGRSEGERPGEGDLDGFEFTLTRRELRQIKAEVWREGYLSGFVAGSNDELDDFENPYEEGQR